MINHMILGNRTLICAIQIIFIPTRARKILQRKISKFRQANYPPERNLASFEDFFSLLLSLMVSDWFSEVFSQ